KAYLMKLKKPHLSNYGIVGSSNFTEPGLCRNIELNLLTGEQYHLEALNKWFEINWKESEDIKDDLIQVIQPHIKHYTPFEIYVKALYEYFLGKEIPVSTWEETDSKLYKIL